MSELLFARIDDILQMAENGIFSYSDFLNESEAAKVRRYISKPAEGIIYSFFGGFEDSERCRFFAYPDYYVFDDNKDCIRAVEIRGSGFAALRHSSFLGALTSLGIDRAKMGDIIISGNSAIVFVDEKIRDFLLSEPSPLQRVGRDTVKVFDFEIPKDFGIKREYKEIFDTIASPRLDAAVSALANVAREKAKGLIVSGNVMLNYIEEQRPDVKIAENDIVTVRGIGKFRITAVGEKTKKDRYRLNALKYI
ncbi:MAG: hypothetical protein E7591_02830 [Ruminococcaceae bacterium]|nr:hypothetical protein [Oscillospiraceae bacterium]